MKKRKSFFWLRAFSAFIDIALVYSLSIILRLIIWNFTFISADVIFITTLLFYYPLSYWFLNGQTPSKSLLVLRISEAQKISLSLKKIVLREVILKGICAILIPLYFIKALFSIWTPLLTIIILVILLSVSLVLLLIFKRPWWELFSRTFAVKELNRNKTLKPSFWAIITVLTVSIFIIIYPFVIEKKDLKNTFYPPYPVTAETTKYADFIKNNSQDPVDYIFELFKQNDIVVLSERLHPEYTQYQFISKIVSDKRFIKDVGNIFTECGSVSFQDTLTTYLHSSFRIEDDLNKSTANLQRNSNAIWPLWSNTNLFDFFKHVNKLNNQLPDSIKINWYFTDLPVDWQTMTHEKQMKAYANPLRDSIMAFHIIEKYRNSIQKQNRHKALVIMNTRHGYGLTNKEINNQFNSRNKGTTAFLMQQFPEKVANVMINTVSIKLLLMFTPVQNGKWETALSQIGNPDAGFNFVNSPFGNDKFDAGVFNAPSLTYKDIFTGFVFYKPLEQHIIKDGFPNEFDNFEDTIIRRAGYVGKSFAQKFKNEIEIRKKYPNNNPINTESVRYFILFNLVTVILAPTLLFISLIISVVFFIKNNRKT